MHDAFIVSLVFALGSAAPVKALSARTSLYADEAPAAGPADQLVITAHIVEQEYCRDRSGIDQLRLKLGFTYTNRGADPLIVPFLTRLSEVRVKLNERMLIRFRHKLKDAESISPEIYTTEAPSPTLFFVLSQGQAREGAQQLIAFRIAPRGTRPRRNTLSPGEYQVEVDLNLGARLPSDPPVSADQWKAVGSLVLGKTTSMPMRLQVADPSHAACVTPRLIL